MDSGTLYNAIAEVCPVLSAKCISQTDRSTWSYQADPSATQPQKDAADNVIATIPVDQAPPPSAPAAALYDHEARIAALESAPVMALEAYLKKRKLV
jgi:hypothetical protein